jgi:hypothetical protein
MDCLEHSLSIKKELVGRLTAIEDAVRTELAKRLSDQDPDLLLFLYKERAVYTFALDVVVRILAATCQ